MFVYRLYSGNQAFLYGLVAMLRGKAHMLSSSRAAEVMASGDFLHRQYMRSTV